MFSKLHAAIRPSINQLRELPTLRQATQEFSGVVGTLDLKFETPTRRFWVGSEATAKGPEAQGSPHFQREFVTMETIDPEAGQSHWLVYGPTETRELQMFDYFQLLSRQLDSLLNQENPESKEAIREEIEAIRREFESLRRLWSEG